MLAVSWSKLWGAVSFAYLTSPPRRKKLLCIATNNKWCLLSCCALHMVLSTAVSRCPSAIPSLSLWRYTLKTPSTLLCVLLSIWIQQKNRAIRETVDFSYPDPKHIRSAGRWLFLPPRSQGILSWRLEYGEPCCAGSLMHAPAQGDSSLGDAATSARFTWAWVLSLQGEFSRGDLCP